MHKDKNYFEKIGADHTGIQAVMHSSGILARYRDFLERRVLRRAMETGSKKILDIGCGNGRFFEFFRAYGSDVHGVDFSESLIKQAKKNYPWAHSKVCFSEKLPYTKEFFDEVYLLLLFSHTDYSSFKKTLSEASRVLKKGGRMVILDEPESKGSVWKKKDITIELKKFDLLCEFFVRSDFSTKLLLLTMDEGKREIVSTVRSDHKEAVVKGSFLKGLLRILIDMWIDLPSVLFRRKEAGIERMLIYKKHG